MRKLLELFFDVDDPPERIGVPGLLIMGLFILFCAYAWFHHTAR